MHHYLSDYSKGSIGILATAGGAAISMFPEVEAWLRVTSLIVGILVGLITIASIYRNNWGNKKK